jgi:hypothetical protein
MRGSFVRGASVQRGLQRARFAPRRRSVAFARRHWRRICACQRTLVARTLNFTKFISLSSLSLSPLSRSLHSTQRLYRLEHRREVFDVKSWKSILATTANCRL